MNNYDYAGVAAVSAAPFWYPMLQQASEVAATIAPLLGLVWLIVQIWAKVRTTLRKGDGNE